VARALAGVSETPTLDADLLLAHVLGLERATLFARGPGTLLPACSASVERAAKRRLAGEPVAYITGRKGFRNLELHVDRRVLVPRPETEQLVDIALDWLRRRTGALRVIDVGTGSGAIALALAAELDGESMSAATTALAWTDEQTVYQYERADLRTDEPSKRPLLPGRSREIEITATDVSSEALTVARENATLLGLASSVQFIHRDLLADVDGAFDLILANLPYLRDDQRDLSTWAEPELALYSGRDGFALYRRFLPQAAARLCPGGLIVIEIDPEQSELAVREATTSTGFAVEVVHDFAGRARFLVLRGPS
jgi:release factor glutamine methyltransferase